MLPVYIGISIAALIIVVSLLLISRGKGKPLRKPSNLATLGMTLVVLGIIFGDNRWIYGHIRRWDTLHHSSI